MLTKNQIENQKLNHNLIDVSHKIPVASDALIFHAWIDSFPESLYLYFKNKT